MTNEKLFKITDLERPIEGWYSRARDGPWWANVHAYAEEMKSGAQFPPILVGEFEGKLIVVDGYHRIEATKNLGEEFIKGVLKKYKSKADLLRDAVEANNHHGIRYTAQDKAHIIRLLEENGIERIEISRLVGVTVEKLENFSVRNILNGGTLKAPLVRLIKDGTLTRAQAEEIKQDVISTMTIEDVIKQLLNYFDAGAYPWGIEKYDNYARRIAEIIASHIQG